MSALTEFGVVECQNSRGCIPSTLVESAAFAQEALF